MTPTPEKRDEHAITQQKCCRLLARRIEGVRKFVKQRPHERSSRSRVLVGKGVQIGHQPITLLR